jgi:hypothetical protein
MYACITEIAAHFSRACAGRRIGHLLFVTHPHHAAIGGGSMPASYMVILASAILRACANRRVTYVSKRDKKAI